MNRPGEDTAPGRGPSGQDARFRQLADSVPHLVWTALPDGTVDYYNARLLDYDAALQQPPATPRWAEAVHPDDRPRALAAWQRALDDGVDYESSHRIRMRDGRYRWHLSRARVARDGGGRVTGWFGTATDIDALYRAEEAVRGAGETFRHLVENSPFGVYVVDSGFRLMLVSAGAQKVFENVRPLIGRDFAEVLRTIWTEPFASEAVARFRHTLATGETYHNPRTVELREDVADVESYDWRIERIRLPDGSPGVVCHFYDLSERLRYEAALRDSERRARDIVESISDGFTTLDRDWRVTYVNPTGRELGARLFGAATEIVGRDFRELMPQIPGTPFFKAYRKAMEDRVPVSVEAFYPPLDSWFDVRCYPTPDGIAIHYLDVGLRKRAEDALRRSEGRFREMADNLPLIVWVHDAEGRQEFVNLTFCAYFGVDRADMQDDRWRNLIHPEDAEGYAAEFMACTRERRPFHREVRVRRADGEWRWVESWAQPRFGEDGAYLGHIGTGADVTERKRTEDIRQLLILELNHRVKNTLSVVQAIAQQSLRTDRAPGEQRELFEGRLRALAAAHDVLTRENWQRGSLAEIVAGARRSCGIEPDRFTARGQDVMLPPQRAVTIAMALHELCTNAIKYGALAAPEGRIRLEWELSGENRDRFRMVWTERGGPPVAPPTRKGFGTRMLERALAADLGASVRVDYAPEGLTCVIEGGLPTAG